ncbi:MAG: ATP-grasp domain-containing protein [Promethearchaeota archaeon]
MVKRPRSVLLIGFNIRPLAYSLNKANYIVYAVDFFGDLDLFPFVKDSIIVMKELNCSYDNLKENYSKYLAQLALKLLNQNKDIDSILIGSGLDDAYEERKLLVDETKNLDINYLNNELNIVKSARDIEKLYDYLNSQGYKTPFYTSFEKFNFNKPNLRYPYVLKKKSSAGGINVFKIKDKDTLFDYTKILENKMFKPSEWITQEYIEGIPISSTVISDGYESEVISINRQIIGEKFLNSPKDFMYCGNIVPAGLSMEENNLISEISHILTQRLGLRGINGFDFVLKDHYPYLMECNPRIPGSIRASEDCLNLNLLDLHVKCFLPKQWDEIRKLINSSKPKGYTTKLIFFAPKDIDKKSIAKINEINYIHDKPVPDKNIIKGAPVCSVLFNANSATESFNGARNVIYEINSIIGL